MLSRVSVTLDAAGNPLQVGYECWDDSGPLTVVTTTFAPFDTPAECFESALLALRQHIGEQASLF